MELSEKPRGFPWERIAVVGLILVALFLIGVIFMGWLQEFAIFGTFEFAVDKIVDASGLSIYLVKGVLVIVLIPFFFAVREIGKIPIFKGVGRIPKGVAWGIVIVYTSAYFFAMYFATKDNYFHHTGAGKEVKATKFYAVTPEGIRFFDTDGFDPKYGIKLKPVTTEIIANLERAKRGDVAKSLVFKSVAEVTFFDVLTGEAKVWFCRNAKGEAKLFSTSGFDPETGQTLTPVTPGLVEELKLRSAEIEARQAAEGKRSEETAKAARAEAEAARATAEKAKAEAQEKAFRDRYVNPGPLRSGDRKEVALLLLGEATGASSLREAFGTALRERGIESTDGLFRPNFVADGSAAKLFAGDSAVAKRLRLGDRVMAVVSIKASHKVAATGDLDADLKTAVVTVEMKCVNVVTFSPCGTGGFTVKGAGFSEDVALQSGFNNAGPEIQRFVRSLAL